mmetsp:Transcript_7559/g.11717  ORF Transcript_7559/g.11717 Transcript_7559/m.11717 type:complete len:188 (-) Transcript_7559:10-573(-)
MAPSINNTVDNACHIQNEDRGGSSCASSCLSVSFSPLITIKEVLHVFDYTPEEAIDTWYSVEDIRRWKTESKRMARGEIPIDEARGIENRSAEASQKKRHNKRFARLAVLQEQANQRREGISDADSIADAYFECNEHCQVAANMVGIRDETEARIIQAAGAKKLDTLSFQVAIGHVDRPKVIVNCAA